MFFKINAFSIDFVILFGLHDFERLKKSRPGSRDILLTAFSLTGGQFGEVDPI